ncbi:hypothetical protein [Chryseobacterium aurantiacum]|uniref:hypothetical protein n=1 Tax=Chryseobacterium aurantiacum TaxID=2116499 RepID=UPI000D12BFEB|nr:hypothetical protein [Chryseobacterium aurantiacum]
MISKETFYKTFFLENVNKFFQYIEDAERFSTENFYNRYHKIIGHPYYMTMAYDEPLNGYSSYLDFGRLKHQIENEDFLFCTFAENINFLASIYWSGTYIDRQVSGIRRLLKAKLKEKEIGYDKKKYKEKTDALELNRKHYGNVLQTGYKFLLLEEELNRKYGYKICYIIRRSALYISYDLPDIMIYYFIIPENEIETFQSYKSDTFHIYTSELFENTDLVEEMNNYCNRFNNPNLPYDIVNNWCDIAKKIEKGIYPQKDAKGNLIIKASSL